MFFNVPVRRLSTVIVTGSNRGIGKATAAEFARRGCNVILACRNVEAAEQAREEMISKLVASDAAVANRIECRQLDLSSLDSVRKFASSVKSADVLVNNAAILPSMKKRVTVDGFEMTFQTNFLGPFLLTNLLYECLSKSPAGGRVINTIADPRSFYLCWPPYGVKFYDPQGGYNQLQAYVRAKLYGTLALTRALHLKARREKARLSTFSVDPGIIDPSIGSNTSPVFKAILSRLPKFMFKTYEQAAETAVYCATEPGLEQFSGSFYQDCKRVNAPSRATDTATARRLWNSTHDLLEKETLHTAKNTL